tara:strand:- start:8927 stop:9361 length:435 start_codon:yes stop_codon:yes gene_type:complete
MPTRPDQLLQVQEEAYELFKQKNADYGDAFAKYGTIGVLVRLGDKIQRLQHISKTDITLVKSESLRDTLIDLHNYAAMAIMLLDEKSSQVVLTNDNSSDEDYDSQSDHQIGSPRIITGDLLERDYVTEHPYMYPQDNGGRCTIS